ncbi:MAG: hypothetical protein Kow00121_32290 [Elainellaceae cyanobacterium]
MTQDVKQWLSEIKLLQQKMAALQQERDEAYTSAANWRNLYEAEAKQRRTEATLSQQAIEALNGQIQGLQELPQMKGKNPETLSLIEQEVEQLEGINELRTALVQALAECDRLAQTLKAEKQAHAQTRKALTTALGDTIDMLNRERARKSPSQRDAAQPTAGNGKAANSVAATTSAMGNSTDPKAVKNPSLELPQLD